MLAWWQTGGRDNCFGTLDFDGSDVLSPSKFAAVAPRERSEFAPWPFHAPDELEAAMRVLESGKVNYWTGEQGRRFEQEFAEYVGAKYAVASANGTVTLELALRALGIGEGDDVIVTPRSFFASVSTVVLAKARPIFADVDRDSGNLSAESIERALTSKTKAILLVHLAGWPCDMDPILALAASRGIAVIEDCAQAHGATYRGQPVGSFGAVGSWSFCQDKIITTSGEGGMLTTDDPSIWEMCWSYKDHGKSYEAVHGQTTNPGFRYVHESFGTNWRLTEVQSAIGRVQLRKLDGWLGQRRANASLLVQRLSHIEGLRTPTPGAGVGHSYYKLNAYVTPQALRADWDRDRILSEVVSRGVPCFSGSCSEIYLEKAFDGTGFRPERRLPVARELGETSLMFLTHPGLSEESLHRVADAVEEVLGQARR